MNGLSHEITDDPRWRRVHDERERHATGAREAQATYLRLTRGFIVGSALAAIAGGLVLYGTEAKPDENAPTILHWLSGGPERAALIIVQGIGLAVAAFCGYLLGRREPGKRWVAARLRAEDGRLMLAQRTLTIGHEKGTDAFRAAGEWFVDFLEGQIRHLDASAQRRDESALRGVIVAAVLAALAALAGVLTGFSSKALVVALAVFGIGIPALTAAVEKWGEATADGKRAELHAKTWSTLNALRDDLPAFETAIEANDLEGALAFADRVFEVLRSDHAGFASVQGEARSVDPIGD